MRLRILILNCGGLAMNSLGAQVRKHAGLGLLSMVLAADYEAARGRTYLGLDR